MQYGTELYTVKSKSKCDGKVTDYDEKTTDYDMFNTKHNKTDILMKSE